MDGAVTSQFENHLRAVMDLPLGSPAARRAVDGDGEHPRRRGRRAAACTTATRTSSPATRGCGCTCTARTVKPGRKVGHVKAYGDDLDECRERARHAAAWFAGELGDESE